MYKCDFVNVDNPARAIAIYRNDCGFILQPHSLFMEIDIDCGREYKTLVDDKDCIIMKREMYFFRMGLFKMLIKGTEW